MTKAEIKKAIKNYVGECKSLVIEIVGDDMIKAIAIKISKFMTVEKYYFYNDNTVHIDILTDFNTEGEYNLLPCNLLNYK